MNNDEQQEIIMFNSDKAAMWTEGISGWVDRGNRFWGDDENAARYSGCTHVLCLDCNCALVLKPQVVCRQCAKRREVKRYQNMPVVEWDEKGMIYSLSFDRFFWDWEEAEDLAECRETTLADMLLVICEPEYLREIDDDFCSDILTEEELPDDVLEAIEKFNNFLRNYGPISWSPGNKAAKKKAENSSIEGGE